MLGGLILVPIVSLLTPKMEAKNVDDIFSCYDVEVETKARNVLPEQKD